MSDTPAPPHLPRRPSGAMSSLSIDLAAIKLSDRARKELEAQIAMSVPDDARGAVLDVTVRGMNQGGRFVVILEGVLRPPDAGPPDGPEVYRYVLR